jgi:hypothetical protein
MMDTISAANIMEQGPATENLPGSGEMGVRAARSAAQYATNTS